MDTLWGYVWGNHPQRLSPGEIKKMKKNMKKVPIISLKSDIYHQKEQQEAEHILDNIPHIHISQDISLSTTKEHYWIISRIKLLRQRFTSLF